MLLIDVSGDLLTQPHELGVSSGGGSTEGAPRPAFASSAMESGKCISKPFRWTGQRLLESFMYLLQ